MIKGSSYRMREHAALIPENLPPAVRGSGKRYLSPGAPLMMLPVARRLPGHSTRGGIHSPS